MSNSALRAPIDRILPSFVPVLFERGIPGYATELLIPGEVRIAPASLRALLIASACLGGENHAASRGLELDRVRETLKHSIHTIPGVSPGEAQEALDLVHRFRSYRFIRAEHPFDDWICEALWPALQTAPYSYPSAMSSAVSYSLTVLRPLRRCVLEY